MDREQFRDPAAEYRGVTLWMLNDRLEAEQLRRQLAGIRQAGWGAVITRTFDGLMTPYLSEEWMSLLRVMVDGARQEGLGVWFQAGYMTGGVPHLPPEHRHYVVAAREPHEEMPGDARQIGRDERFVYYEQRLSYFLDLINPQAVTSYLRQAYDEPYLPRFAGDFGDSIQAIWVDEPRFRPPLLPWAERLHQRFRERWGYELRDHAAALFRRVGEFRKVRHHYWRTVTELFIEGYFEPVQRWCEEHGVWFAGHLMGEDTLTAQSGHTAACMPLYPYMHVPGIDHLTASLNWSHGLTERAGSLPFILTPKQCSSAAHQAGRRRVLAEMFGVSTEGLTFADRKHIGDWFAALGINDPCMHGTFYSLRGRRKRYYVPHLSYQQPWWSHSRLITDYAARRNYALRQGRHHADVLVLHPIESAWCLYGPRDDGADGVGGPQQDARDLNRDAVRLSESLLRSHRSFDYGDETILARMGAVEGDRLRVGEARYRAVVLPSLVTLRRSTLDLLNAFIDAGGAVLRAGDAPTCVEGEPHPDALSLVERTTPVTNEPAALRQALAEVAPTDIALSAGCGDGQMVWLHERRDGERRILFVANVSPEHAFEGELRLPAAGGLEEWDLATGSVAPVEGTPAGETLSVPLRLAPAGSRLLVSGPGTPQVREPRRTETVRRVKASGPWHVQRLERNALVLDFCRIQQGDGEMSMPVPVIAAKDILADYEGPLTMRFEFTVEAVPQSAHIVVEDADECRIRINGLDAPYDGLPPWVDGSFLPVDASGLLKRGTNALDISRDYRPLQQPQMHARFENLQGVELEQVYVTGDFGVLGSVSAAPQRPGAVRFSPEWTIVEERSRTAGDLLTDGYPFYAGTVCLTVAVDLERPTRGQRVVLCLDRPQACVIAVSLNDEPVGKVAWPPYELDVTDLVRNGGNRLRIELTNTLRNLIGRFHHPEGESKATWGEWVWRGWTAKGQQGEWWQTREPELNQWTDDYFLVPFGLTRRTAFEYREPV